MSRTSGARFPDPPDGNGSPPQRWLVRVPVVTTYTYIVEANDRSEAETKAIGQWERRGPYESADLPVVDLDIIESEEL